MKRVEGRKVHRPAKALDLVLSQNPRFEYNPQQEFTSAEQAQLQASVVQELEQESHTRIPAAWLLHTTFPDLASIPKIQDHITGYVKKKKIRLAQVLQPELRRNEGEYFFQALLAFRALCPDQPEAWPKGVMDQTAKEAAQDLLEYVMKSESGELVWNSIAHHGLYMLEIPELRSIVDDIFSHTKDAAGQSFDQALESKTGQPITSLYDVQLKTLRRLWKGLQGADPGGASDKDLIQIHHMLRNAKKVFARPPHIQVYSVLMYNRCLSLLGAGRLDFPHNGPVQPVWQRLPSTPPPLPERLE